MSSAVPAPAPQDADFVVAGDRCAARLYRPATPGPYPTVLMAHGFGAHQGEAFRLPHFARAFAAAGLLAISFDYRGFGRSDGRPRQWLSIARQRDDWRAALAWVRTRPEVDASRLALWGTSFSAGHVLTIAATDHALRAVIAHVPFVDGITQLTRPALPPARLLRLGLIGLRDAARAGLGMPPLRIPIVGAPGDLAALTTPDAEPALRRMIGDLPLSAIEQEVCARIVLGVALDRPIRHVHRIRAPVLYVIASDDAITPADRARAAAAATPNGQVHEIAGGHFDPYVAPRFDGNVARQTAFLHRHLAA